MDFLVCLSLLSVSMLSAGRSIQYTLSSMLFNVLPTILEISECALCVRDNGMQPCFLFVFFIKRSFGFRVRIKLTWLSCVCSGGGVKAVCPPPLLPPPPVPGACVDDV